MHTPPKSFILLPEIVDIREEGTFGFFLLPLMDVSWGSTGDSRVSASGGVRTAHADGQAERHGHLGQSSGEEPLALGDFQTVPGLRRGLDNAL